MPKILVEIEWEGPNEDQGWTHAEDVVECLQFYFSQTFTVTPLESITVAKKHMSLPDKLSLVIHEHVHAAEDIAKLTIPPEAEEKES